MSFNSYTDSVALTFKTNAMSAIDITSSIGVEPDSFINAGESVRTTYGSVFKTGLQSWSLWTREYEIETVNDSCGIEAKVIEIIELCEPHKSFIGNILGSGGVADIQVRLVGDHNIGDTFSAVTLNRLSGLGMRLSIEVFPASSS